MAADGGLAISSTLFYPLGLAVDPAGDLYIGEADFTVRKVSAATGLLSTIGTTSEFARPSGLLLDTSGNLYIAQQDGYIISQVSINSPMLAFGSVAANTTSAAQTVQVTNDGNAIENLAALTVSSQFGEQAAALATDCMFTGDTVGTATLAPGQSCNLSLVFAPTTGSGAQTGTAAFTGQTINLSGTITPAPTTVGVTIASSPSALSFSVTGTGCAPGSYTSPQTLQWTPASSCTVAFTTPQAGSLGTQYAFLQWEDSSTSASRAITAPAVAATYTATFQTQYLLTTSVSPSVTEGSILPATAYVNAGMVVSVSATANAGYMFSGFSGGLGGATNPQNISVTAPVAVTASFVASPASVAVVAGSPQSAEVNTPFGMAMQAIVEDASNNPLSGVMVTFTAPDTGASGTFPGGQLVATVSTNASGIATAPTFAANGTLGGFTVAASVLGIATPANFALTNSVPILPPTGVVPGAGSGLTQTFTFTFTDSAGYGDLSVLDILINSSLNGVGACYVAFAPASATSGYLYLVDDAADGGYVTGTPMLLGSSNSLQNSQCTINATGSSASASGNTLTLTLAITFAPAFAGNQITYMGARNSTQDSGWQALGTWNVPGLTPTGPAVSRVSPGRSASMGQTYAFTFTDTNGYGDLAVLDVLANNFLNGIAACYVAFTPTSATTGYLYLVDDAGDGGYAAGSPIALPSSSILQNSQCTIDGSGSSVAASGNSLTLNLAITFSSSFGGNQLFYLAARNNSTGNSGWQPVGSVTVP
jgi:Divergent InlB B-repeat domain